MSELMPKGTAVTVKMWDCGPDCQPHPAHIITVDEEDPMLPYEVEYDDGSHRTWAEIGEVTKS